MSEYAHNLVSTFAFMYHVHDDGPFAYSTFRDLSGATCAGPLDPNDTVFKLSSRDKACFICFRDAFVSHVRTQGNGKWPRWTSDAKDGQKVFEKKILSKISSSKFLAIRRQAITDIQSLDVILRPDRKIQDIIYLFLNLDTLELIIGTEAVDECSASGFVDAPWTTVLKGFLTASLYSLRTTINRKTKKENGQFKHCSELYQELKNSSNITADSMECATEEFRKLKASITSLDKFMGREDDYEGDDRHELLNNFDVWMTEIGELAGSREPDEMTVKDVTASASVIGNPEIEAAWIKYRELFHSDVQYQDLNSVNEMSLGREFFNDGNDYGTQSFSALSLTEIYQCFGIEVRNQNQPSLSLPMLNTTADSGGSTRKLELRWHQIGGVHMLLTTVFSKTSRKRIPGVLNGDEVGLGKTAFAIASIAMLAHTREIFRQWKDKKCESLPPLFRERTYFGSEQEIPNLPTLIIAPPNLIDNWKRELNIWLDPIFFEIFVYAGKNRSKIFAPGGAWGKSQQPSGHRIVLASTSAIQQDGDSCLVGWRNKRADNTPCRLSTHASKNVTLNSIKWLKLILDEAHYTRTPTTKLFKLITHLSAMSEFSLLLTATPLFTAPKDLLSIATLIGTPGLVGDQGATLAKEMRKTERVASQQAKGDDTVPPADVTGDIAVELWRRGQRMAIIHSARLTLIARCRTLLAPYFLRRTVDSVDNNGLDLLRLPLLTTLTYFVPMYKEEETALEKTLQIILEQHSRSGKRHEGEVGRLDTTNFWLYPRMHGVHSEVVESNRNKTPLWLPENLEEWKAKPSSKLDTLISICTYYRDTPVEISSQRYWRPSDPASVKTPGTLFANTDDSDSAWDYRSSAKWNKGVYIHPEPQPHHKGIIYCAWTAAFDLIVRVLNLHGHYCSIIHGGVKSSKRTRLIDEFQRQGPHKDSKGRAANILLMSSVGAAGLNMQRATWLIFADMTWGAGENIQLTGRPYRQGQLFKCYIYHLLHCGTIDELMQKGAGCKEEMLQMVASSQGKLKELLLMSEELVDADDEAPAIAEEDEMALYDEDQATEPVPEPKRRKPAPAAADSSTIARAPTTTASSSSSAPISIPPSLDSTPLRGAASSFGSTSATTVSITSTSQSTVSGLVPATTQDLPPPFEPSRPLSRQIDPNLPALTGARVLVPNSSPTQPQEELGALLQNMAVDEDERNKRKREARSPENPKVDGPNITTPSSPTRSPPNKRHRDAPASQESIEGISTRLENPKSRIIHSVDEEVFGDTNLMNWYDDDVMDLGLTQSTESISNFSSPRTHLGKDHHKASTSRTTPTITDGAQETSSRSQSSRTPAVPMGTIPIPTRPVPAYSSSVLKGKSFTQKKK